MIRASLRQLSYFAAAARLGSTLAAARALHVSQPSVSHAIAELENHWGETLFHRLHAQGLELTTAGSRRFERVQVLLDLAAEVDQAMGAEMTGRLTIAGMTTLMPMYLPAIMRRFTQRHPQVELRLIEGDTEALLTGIERGTLDLALLYDMGLGRAVDLHDVGQQAPYVLLPADHRLAGHDTVSLQSLADEPWILINLPHSRQYFLSLLAMAEVRPRVALESVSLEMVRSLVANGHGVSLLTTRPDQDSSYDGKPLACKPLKESFPSQKIVLAAARGRPLSVVAQAFVQVTREQLQSRSG